MLKNSITLFGSLACIFLFAQSGHAEKWTNEDIVKYEKISPRLAVAYGNRGQALGVYDLSYMGPEKSPDEKSVEAKSDENSDWVSFGQLNYETAAKSLDRKSTSNSPDRKKGLRAIGDLKTWAESNARRNQTLNLSDLVRSKELGPNRDQLESAFRDVLKPVALLHANANSDEKAQELLKDIRFKFEKNKIVFEMKRPKAEVPFLLGDFKETRKIFGRSMGYVAYQTAMKAVMGMIEIPYLSPLIDTLFSRLFKFLNSNIKAHELALFGALADCETLDSTFGSNHYLCDLPEADRRMLMKTAFLGSELSVAGLKDLVLNVEKMVENKVQKEKKRLAESAKYFSKKNYNVVRTLGPYVIASSKHVDSGLYIMQEPKWWGLIQKPDIAIDYKHLSTPFVIRMGLIINSPGIEYGLRFVPYVGGTIAGLYSGTVEKPFYSALEYEYRMLTYLEGREADLGEDYTLEKKVLYKQNVNPFDPGQKNTEKWIRDWSSLLNI